MLCVAITGSAHAQPRNNTKAEAQIRGEWNKLSNELGSTPWVNLIEKLTPLVDRAKHLENGGFLRDYLDAMHLARDYKAPEGVNVIDATPEQLVGMLTNSRFLGRVTTERRVITAPLLYMSGTTDLFWERMTNKPLHPYVDPAVVIFQRGREMIPALIDALDDMTATRSYLSGSGTQWAVMLRRSDFAMAMIEAITRTEFAPVQHRHGFAQNPKETRDDVIAIVREWWDENKDADPIQARVWPLQRVGVPQALRAINLLTVDGHDGLAVEHLHKLLNTGDITDDHLRDVARRLAILNDNAGIERMHDRMATSEADPGINDLRVLALFGGRKEFEWLAERYTAESNAADQKKKGSASTVAKSILSAVQNAENPLAAIVFAEALFRDDQLVHWPEKSSRPPYNWAPPDIAAEHIQRLTGRDFGYNPRMTVAQRRVAIDRIGEWWQKHGQKHHRTVSATDGRTDAIR